MTLLAMQRDMRRWLDKGDDFAASRIGTRAAPGLRVYQNNYRAQLIACLDETFPHTRDWIGGEAFHAAMVAHIERVSPSSWTLDAYPRDFPATLAMLYADDAEVAELAWIEQALGEAFVGPDAPALASNRIAEVDWDTAILRFTSTLDQAPLTTNAAALWAAMEAQKVPPPAIILDQPGAVLVWRYEQVSRFRAIEREELDILLLARAGTSFADLCAALVEARGEEAGIARAGQLLGNWIAEGVIIAIEDTQT
ncbi:MAG: DNA-binding domain-containing protein [Sphingomonas sp.]